ncbi:MAG: type II secretion system secretin GspD [Gallionellaceae bacterium]|jgi:general secretion pathway protein D|nr:type II secretion system secretin GspD [Gallionellaceae bacterium]
MKKPYYTRCGWMARMLLCAALFLSATAMAAQDEKISLNFVNADIGEVVKAISQITGRNFLIDPRVKGTVNIVSTTPVPAPLAYDILLSALRMQGFAAVESDGVTKVLPEADAKLYVGASGGKGGGDKLVTRVYMLKYESATQLVPVLRPLIAPNNIVVAYPSNNALVVTDYASNLKRIEQIVDSIDQPSAEAPVIIPVKYASAVDLAQTINRLMTDTGLPPGSDASTRFVLTSDARTNSILMRSDNPERVARVRDLVGKLDTKTGATGNIHVIYLKNAEAVRVAQTLRSVLSGDSSDLSSASSGSSKLPPGTASSSSSTGSSSTTSPSTTTGNSSSFGSSFGGSSANGSASTAQGGGGMVQADAASNALIITAPDAVYNNLRAVVDMLDVRRAQVYVEALIAEVTADKAAEFGIQWNALSGLNKDGTNVIGGTNFGTVGQNILGTAAINGTNATSVLGAGLNIGVVKGMITLPDGTQLLNLGMLARALQTDANTNILSTPNLLTLDNEEAEIVVGQNVPFVTGTYAQTGSATTATPFTTVDRQDVGLTLRIKPQITEGGVVRLQIYQEVSSVDNTATSSALGLGPTTNKRSIESTVLVDEGQIIVLGGLIQDSVTDTVSKVPLLGDIPLLGNLFRYNSRQHTKTNLMVFIRPYVLRTAEASQGLTQDRYEYLRGVQAETQPDGHLVLPSMNAPTFAPLQIKAPEPPVTPPASAPSAAATPAPAEPAPATPEQ